jgi:hypothetical protein
VRAEAAPASTVFRYRFVDAGNPRMVPWRVGTVAGTASRYASTATITFGVGAALWTKVQIQACSDNGCSAWVERQIYTGS